MLARLRHSVLIKVLGLLVLTVLLCIPLAQIESLTRERGNSQREAAAELASTYTGAQTLTPDASVDDAIKLMRDHAVRRIPVVQDDRPVGIVSLGDLAIGGSGEQALDDISAASPNN